jgi:radical SAM protein (TIGR01212 family)
MRETSHSSSYTFHGKPYNFFGDFLREKYGFRIFKLPINSSLNCPHRNSDGGCIFCSESGSASPVLHSNKSITEQMLDSKNSFVRSDVLTKYIAYFQAYTNTNADIGNLKRMYDEAVSFPDIVGLMIGTRPDCIDEKVAELISSYKKSNFELWVEIGMQSSHDRSLDYLNRCHSNKDTIKSIELLEHFKIQTLVHIILGIPGEKWKDMMDTAELLSSLPVAGVKIHHLHVLKNTPLETLYEKGRLQLLSHNEFTSLVCDFIERLRPDILIHRLSGDALETDVIAPRWGLQKGTVSQNILDEFHRRGSWQGFLYNG